MWTSSNNIFTFIITCRDQLWNKTCTSPNAELHCKILMFNCTLLQQLLNLKVVQNHFLQ